MNRLLQWWRKRRPPVDELRATGELDEICNDFIKWVRWKARRNEQTSRWLLTAIAAASAAIPLFVVMSTQWLPFILGKVMPAALAAIVAAFTTSLAYMRPLERWRLYRRYERILEAERLKYVHEIDPYQGESRDTEFANTLTRLHLDLQDQWAGLVPKSSDVADQAHGSA